MPESFFYKMEKEQIKKRLKTEAKKYLSEHITKKISVDEIIEQTEVSQGMFRLCYPSKEVFLFEVLLDYQNAMEKEAWNEVNLGENEIPDQRLEEILVKRYRLACVNEQIMELILPL